MLWRCALKRMHPCLLVSCLLNLCPLVCVSRALRSLLHITHPQVTGGSVGGSKVVIDGACENSPFSCPQSLATFANHSRKANAVLEDWPVPDPGPCELHVHMMLVATEPIEPGCEVRINYEHGGSSYWNTREMGFTPAETGWRAIRVRPPPPLPEPEPIFDRLTELRTAAALSQAPPPCTATPDPPANSKRNGAR